MADITVNAKMIARMAYGYELMFSQMCNIAGTSGGHTHWYTQKAQEITGRVDPLWKLNESSNAHKPGDCLSQHIPFAAWAFSLEHQAEGCRAQLSAPLWRVFEDVTHGWWGIEEDIHDGNTILYPKKISRESLDGVVRARNASLTKEPNP